MVALYTATDYPLNDIVTSCDTDETPQIIYLQDCKCVELDNQRWFLVISVRYRDDNRDIAL